MNDFHNRCVEIAKRFLQTAVVVDDEAQIETFPQPHESLRKPGRGTSTPNRNRTETETEQDRGHSLDARAIVDSFAEHGMICGVIAPRPDHETSNNMVPTMKRADIIVLDWQLNSDNGKKSLSMLRDILQDDDEQLRLIAVYTGEENISRIGQAIKEEMQRHERRFESKNGGVVLSYQHCRIVIYAKSGTQLEPEMQSRSVSESDVAKRLIDDFADMAKGLLPSIALVSLAAIRENAHKVLDKFQADLDPAFLAHRACLSSPADCQQHMVSLLASELHAIMDDTVATENPAGMEAIKDWLVSAGQNTEYKFGSDKTLSFDEVLTVLRDGLEHEASTLNKSHFKFLSSGFAGTTDNPEKLDSRLAWMINFRTVFNAPLPKLHLGTVLRKHDGTGNTEFFLCMRPRCDSVRLKGEESFLFLPLLFDEKGNIQLVLHTDENTYRRFGVGAKSSHASQWLLTKFSPRDEENSIIAEQDSKHFFFTDAERNKFEWLGELKAEFAQRIAQHFALELSRVAVNNSEWLRRWENR